MASADDDWTQGWSWDLPAKPLADQLGPAEKAGQGDTPARHRRPPFWRLRRRRPDLAAATPSGTGYLVG